MNQKDAGQASLEYALVLTMVLVFLSLVTKQLIKPVFNNLTSQVSQRLQSQFSPAGLYYFQVH